MPHLRLLCESISDSFGIQHLSDTDRLCISRYDACPSCWDIVLQWHLGCRHTRDRPRPSDQVLCSSVLLIRLVFAEALQAGYTEVKLRCIGLAVRDIIQPHEFIMGAAKASPLLCGDVTSFYQPYAGTGTASQPLEVKSRQETDLFITNTQYLYHAIHARILPTRLPPKNAQLEDADVLELMKLVHQEGRLPTVWLKEMWNGVFNANGFPPVHRRQIGKPAVTRDANGTYRYVCIKGVYTLCDGGQLRTLQENSPNSGFDTVETSSSSTTWSKAW